MCVERERGEERGEERGGEDRAVEFGMWRRAMRVEKSGGNVCGLGEKTFRFSSPRPCGNV